MEIATDAVILSVRISAGIFPALRTSATTLCIRLLKVTRLDMAERKRLVELGDKKPSWVSHDPLTVLVLKQSSDHFVAVVYYVVQTFDSDTGKVDSIIPEAQVIDGTNVDDAYQSVLDWIVDNISDYEGLIDPKHN